jgi:hypothetical protein
VKAGSTVIQRRFGWLAGHCIVLAFMASSPTSARGATFPELYTVSVAPDPAAANLRADAERRAMAVLLTRITGRRETASQEEMAGLVRNAGDYVTSYQSASDEIRVGFSRVAVNEVLDGLSLPYWGAERPSTLVWIAADLGGGQRSEIMADTTATARREGEVLGAPAFPLSEDARVTFDLIVDDLITTADERGLPIVLPLLDARDRMQVRFADVWGGFDQFVATAAERYAVDAVLVGRVAVTTFGLEVRWTLLRGEQRQTRLTTSVREGMDWLADEFAAQFTTVGSARLTWVNVRDVESYADFGRVFEYLQSVSVIDSASVNVESWSAGSLLIRLAARGDDERLRQYLELDGVLRAAPVTGVGFPQGAPGGGRLEFVPGWHEDPGATGRP